MVSIIICSRSQTINDVLSENIENTVGCAYELVVIDNSDNKYSIFEAYNRGIEKSKGMFFCFIHDDILFHTQNWGLKIKEIFQSDSKIGLIGVAGTKTKTKMPSAWWDCPEEEKVMNIMQHFPKKGKENWQFGFENESIKEVVVIDGVFMAMRKDKNIRFSNEVGGFHNYDLNLSLEYIKNGYKIIVTNDILIEHFSLGTIDQVWLDSTYKIHNLFKDVLPLSTQKNKSNKKMEVANAIRFIEKCMEYNKNRQAISIWRTLFSIHPISKYHYRFWKRIIKNKLC
jgi:glycosyltransferase involved in cell wall biosynthesis